MSTSFAPSRETDILREISLYLRYQRRFFWRINTMGTWDPVRKFYLKSPNITRGVSDLMVLHGGRLIAVEVKSAKGRQSPEQLEFQQKIEANGGTYIVARSVQDVINAGL